MLVSDLAQVLFSVPADVVDAVANLLTEETGAGIEQRDAETYSTSEQPQLTELVVWMPASDVNRSVAAVERLLASLGEMGRQVDGWSWRSQEAKPENWLEVYKQHLNVTRLARHTVVKPTWREYQRQPNDLVIEMDPGQAFGTGLHASTRLAVAALERIARLSPAPNSVLDVGCGTGILAMVAAKLWPRADVLAIDNDPVAVEVARSNAQRNGLAGRVRIEQRSAEQTEGRYGVVMANLSLELLRDLQSVLRLRLATFGRMILSGLLVEQAGEIARLYTSDLLLEPKYSADEAGWRSFIVGPPS